MYSLNQYELTSQPTNQPAKPRKKWLTEDECFQISKYTALMRLWMLLIGVQYMYTPVYLTK